MLTEEDKHQCLRCGQCCMAVGKEFWLCGDYKNKPQYKWLYELSKRVKDEGDGLPCRMLLLIYSKAYCLIQLLYGYEAKPKVCREYPPLKCHQILKTFEEQGICYKEIG